MPSLDETQDARLASASGRSPDRLVAYERQTSTLMLVVSLAYIALYAVDVLATDLPISIRHLVVTASNTIWVAFFLDLLIRVYLAPSRWRYLLHHPVDVIAVVLPAFRALRALRIITAGQWILTRGSSIVVGRSALAVLAGAFLLVVVSALAMLDAERTAPTSSITNFGDALWWAFVSVTTVGYGDAVPVTDTGRVVAVLMMIVGIGVLGLVSATMAAALLSRLRGEEATDREVLLARIDVLESKIDSLHITLVKSDSS